MEFDKICNVLVKLCTHGDLSQLQEMSHLELKHIQHNNNYAFRYACCYGHLEVLKWLVDTFKLTIEDARSEDNDAFRCACSHGQLEVLKWLVDKFELTIEDARSDNNCAFRCACWKGHLEVLKWLVDTFELTLMDVRSLGNDALNLACKHGHLNILQFLIGCFQLSKDDYVSFVDWYWISLMTKACEEENGFMVSWFLINFPRNRILLNRIPKKWHIFVKEILNENENEIMIKPASKHCT